MPRQQKCEILILLSKSGAVKGISFISELQSVLLDIFCNYSDIPGAYNLPAPWRIKPLWWLTIKIFIFKRLSLTMFLWKARCCCFGSTYNSLLLLHFHATASLAGFHMASWMKQFLQPVALKLCSGLCLSVIVRSTIHAWNSTLKEKKEYEYWSHL